MAATSFELKVTRVYVAGHRGMVGSVLARRLAQEEVELVTVDRHGRPLQPGRRIRLVRKEDAASRFSLPRPKSAVSSPTIRGALSSSTIILPSRRT